MRLNITSIQASELIEHLKSYIDIADGDCGTALRSKDDFYEVIEKLKEIFDMEQWSFEIDE